VGDTLSEARDTKTKMKKIRVGVIGVGAMGKHHVRIYHEMRDVELVGVSDVNARTAAEIATDYDTEAFINCEQLLNKDLDAVSIAVPTSLHKEIVSKTTQYGAHMLIEKPIADSLGNADAIIDVAGRKNLKLMIGHIERFNPAILKLKELIDAGELGEILSISCRRVGPYAPRIRDVGIITDLAVHDIDTISYLYGKRAIQVYSIAGNSFHIKEDYASLLLQYDAKRSGTVETNWLTPYKMRTLTATGTGGVASADYLTQSLELWTDEGRINVEIEKEEPLKIELAQFVDAIRNGKEPSPSGEEGKYVLSVAIAAIESYQKGYNVHLNR
jgi:UDP-N-acetylglucosamine 3-dehydrogenase